MIFFYFFPFFLSIQDKIIFAISILELYRTPLHPDSSNAWYFDLIQTLSQYAIKEILIIIHQQPTGNHHFDVRKATGSTACLWGGKLSEVLTYSAGFILWHTSC